MKKKNKIKYRPETMTLRDTPTPQSPCHQSCHQSSGQSIAGKYIYKQKKNIEEKKH